MLKYCVEKWDNNKKKLEKAIREDKTMNDCGYTYLVELVVEHIFNGDDNRKYLGSWSDSEWDSRNITTINDGHYQGSMLFMIPLDTYQPSASDYLLTHVSYGSCSGCDTLQSIQDWGTDYLSEQQVKDFMSLCLHLVQNTIKPVVGWEKNLWFTSAEDDYEDEEYGDRL